MNKTKTIKIDFKWVDACAICLDFLERANSKTKQKEIDQVRSEMYRMAKIADKYVTLVRGKYQKKIMK